MKFRNPTNGYVANGGGFGSFLLTLLFGPLYFLAKGVWNHAAISFFAALMTAGISWLVYPFFAPSIVNAHYQKTGWIVAKEQRQSV